MNCIFTKKELPITQRLGIISCLQKCEKPRQFLKNWRPITLLNVFNKLKLFAKELGPRPAKLVLSIFLKMKIVEYV